MIIRTRRRNESFLRRIFEGKSLQPNHGLVLDSDSFQLEILKEIYRSDRRSSGREFALIRMLFSDSTITDILDSPVIDRLTERLRISDSIGCYDNSLAVLLPETGKEGAFEVANQLAKICLEVEKPVDTEVSIYPWDDNLVSLSDELKSDDKFCGTGGPHFESSERESQIQPNDGDPPVAFDSANLESVKKANYQFVRPLPTPWWKRTIDIVGAGFGLLLLAPIFVVAAILIKATSNGPVFFRQMREGKDGKVFGILKFRTMIVDAEAKQAELRGLSEQDGPAFKLKNDPRITKVGKYLRKSCIDELPQLWNILIGDMSLVGPRPLPVGESYGCKVWERARLTVLPGLTCIWQARGGRDVKFEEWMRMDLEYINKRSFLFDLRLIIETAFIALLHKGSV